VDVEFGGYLPCLSQKERFSTFEKLDGGVVIMGNDHACQIVRIGTIRIKIFDGGS